MSGRAGFTVASIAVATLASSALIAEDLSGYSGQELFGRFCASCHGARGEGDGPVASYFKLLPPDLTRTAARHGGEFPAEKMRRIIDGRANVPPHGARGMPVWGVEFAAAQDGAPDERTAETISRLVEFLRSIQRP